jgi:cysteine-rich repeat protein
MGYVRVVAKAMLCTGVRRLAVLPLLACLAVAGAAHATVADDLCAPGADPCVVNGTVTLGAGSTIDVGARALVFGAAARVTLPAGPTVLRAGTLQLLPGARITGPTTGMYAALTLGVAGDVEVQAAGSVRARIDLSNAFSAGVLDVTAGGTVRLDGDIVANGTTSDSVGGVVSVAAGADLLAGGGSIVLRSGSLGAGGEVTLTAVGRIALGSRVDVSGGEFGGGELDVEAGTDVTVTAPIDASGGGAYGDGGFVTLTAVDGSLEVLATITGSASGSSSEGGGTGASVTLFAGQAVTVSSTVSVTGAIPDGSGGSVYVEAGTNASLLATLLVGASGVDSSGGEVDVRAGRDVTFGRVDLSAGGGGGGFLGVSALGTASFTALVSVDGATSFGSGGIVEVDAASVDVGAVVRASGPDGGFGGVVLVSGCTITVRAAGELRSNGLMASTHLQAGGLATIAGKLSATGGQNVVEYRDVPPVVTGVVTPATTPVQNAALPACPPSGAACGDGVPAGAEECDDANTVACDGCSATCRLEACGNGRVECDEECDDGPQTGLPGSACDATCHVIPTAGGVQWVPGGRSRNACFFEWAVRNPNAPTEDGFPSTVQRCIDGDPACDGDGASDGACRFEVAGCLAADDPRLPACQPAGVAEVTLKAPNPVKVTAPADVARAAALVEALAGLGVTVKAGSTIVSPGGPVLGRDRCTAPMAVTVPHPSGAAGSVPLEVAAQSTGGGRMRRNAIQLVCEPNRAVCGNGTIEIGEQCDDGNTDACDGCSPACRPETCGDGVVACGEECDAGAANGTPASDCSATCTFVVPPLRIPGGGSKATDCQLETAIDLAAPAVDRKGVPSPKQTCVDGDPGCDRDPVAGSCGFATWACVAGGDPRLGCAPDRVETLEVRRPTSRDTGALAALRATLLDALGAHRPSGPGEVCSGRMILRVPADKRWAKLQLRTRNAAGRQDTDTLRLRCLPR